MKYGATVARRYAKALLMIAVEQQKLDLFQEQLEEFLNIISGNEKIREVLNNPRYQPEEKKAVLQQVLEGKFDRLVVNLLYLVVDKKREEFFPEIVREYIRYADDARNIVHGEIRSAVELTDKDFRELERKMSSATGKNVRLHVIIEPSLLGGLVVRVGETVIDGSVLKRLSLLKSHLRKSSFKELG